jgi:hypothetical protein
LPCQDTDWQRRSSDTDVDFGGGGLDIRDLESGRLLHSNYASNVKAWSTGTGLRRLYCVHETLSRWQVRARCDCDFGQCLLALPGL